MNCLIKICLYILILISASKIRGQIFNSILIKTHPLRDVIALNPNIDIEKILNKKFSLELEATYKNRDNQDADAKNNPFIWNYNKCTGFRILTGIKNYIIQTKYIPYSWYLLGQIGYRDINLTDYTEIDKEPWGSLVNINKQIFEINVLFGKQFHIYNNLSSEINFGSGIFWENYQSKLIGGFNTNDKWGKNGLYKENDFNPNFFINWTIGYLIKN